MPIIPVIENPFKSRATGRKGRNMKRKRKASAKQLAALARGRAKMAAKRARKAAAPSRPKRRRIVRRHKASRRRRIVRQNPFLGGLAMLGNPRKRRKSQKSHRKSHRRSRRSMILRNPLPSVLAAPREMAKGSFIQEAASVAAGFVLPNVVMQFVPANFRNTPWKGYASKVAVVAVLAGASSLVSKRVSKAIMLGGGVSILLDLYTDFIAPMIHGAAPAAAAAPAGVNAYYGDDAGVSTYFGDNYGLGDAMGSSEIGE